MLRVLHVIGVMDRAGAESLIMNLYRAINRSKIQFDFLVHETREGDFDEEIRSLGGAIYRIPRLNGVNGLAYRMRCREFFVSHPEHTIIHGHIGSSAGIYLSEAKKAGRFTIAHSHSQDFLPGIPGVAFKLLTHSTRRIADYFMACSIEAGRDRFGERIVNGDRFHVLNNGIDVRQYRCNAEEHEDAKRLLGYEGVPLFGHVGRLAPEKNHRFLFETFCQILHELPDAKLLLAGRGPLENELKALAAKMGIADAIDFAGVRSDVPTLLKAMDAFIFPSIKEGLALAVVEAQACGLPCVVSEGVPDLAIISSRTQRLPLSAGAKMWKDAALAAYQDSLRLPRRDDIGSVVEHGFDIATTARWLSEFYEQAARKA